MATKTFRQTPSKILLSIADTFFMFLVTVKAKCCCVKLEIIVFSSTSGGRNMMSIIHRDLDSVMC